jgi:heme-degrading monooxygenase HmoA
MIAVIFEVTPNGDSKQEYLDIAAELRAHLKHIEGFISIERFQSLVDPNKILSLSFWNDEDAIKQWRNLEEHRQAQSKGRSELFMDYRIRVASVTRDYSSTDRKQVPKDSKIAHDNAPGE